MLLKIQRSPNNLELMSLPVLLVSEDINFPFALVVLGVVLLSFRKKNLAN